MFPWSELIKLDPVAGTIFIFCLVAALGLTIGSIRFAGIQLGIAGVLFAGILVGHFQVAIDHAVLEFTRDLGLILFVYTIGVQVGPGFLSSLKKDGLRLNVMAAFIVVLGAGITVLLSLWAKIPIPAAVGIFSGATTNTPSLGAAQEALKELGLTSGEMAQLPSLGYAVAYPFGILGIILSMLLIRALFRINVAHEVDSHAQLSASASKALTSLDIRVDNPNLNGKSIAEIPLIKEGGIIVSRLMHESKVAIAFENSKIFVGDVLHAVGQPDQLEKLVLVIGSPSPVNILDIQSDITAERIIISRPEFVGKTIDDLDVRNRYGVTITRVIRAEIELQATPEVVLNYADVLLVVGQKDNIQKFAGDVGNSAKQLDHPFVIPVFVGIALGISLGSIPISLPGVPSPVKLGLAGGPLLAAIILSGMGRVGHLIWYLPAGANFMLRELGIVLFLACVGLKSGGQFVSTILSGQGLYWMACGALITLVPILILGIYARMKYRMNYLTICGILAGSMTDPPALAFANGIAASNAASVAYTTVYPLTMLLRVISAQIIVIYFMN